MSNICNCVNCKHYEMGRYTAGTLYCHVGKKIMEDLGYCDEYIPTGKTTCENGCFTYSRL